MLQAMADSIEFSGEVALDLRILLAHHGFPKTAAHCADVAKESYRLAERFGADSDKAEIAGWLHDVSAVFPSIERAHIARQLGVDVLPEEAVFPMLIHQKLSVVLARELFGVEDEAILSAIGCHTTLKRDASLLDKVVFVADKIAWDQPGDPPYLAEILAALDKSIDHAALVYLQYLWDKREQLKVLHPWAKEAYEELQEIVRK